MDLGSRRIYTDIYTLQEYIQRPNSFTNQPYIWATFCAAHSRTRYLTHPPILTLTHSLTHSLLHSLTHSLRSRASTTSSSAVRSSRAGARYSSRHSLNTASQPSAHPHLQHLHSPTPHSHPALPQLKPLANYLCAHA